MRKKFYTILIITFIYTLTQPITEWTRMFASNQDVLVGGICRDSRDDIYIVLNLKLFEDNHKVNLVKFNKQGDKIWTKQIGSGPNVYINAISVDKYDNIYIAGYTTGNLEGYINNRAKDAYVAVYSKLGENIFSYTYGSDKDDVAKSICVDDRNNIFYVVGETKGNIGSQLNKGGIDVFITKFDKHILWNLQLGGLLDDMAHSVALSKDSNFIYIVGKTGSESFFAKLDSSGKKLFKKLSGQYYEFKQIIIDSYDIPYVVGTTNIDCNGCQSYKSFITKIKDENIFSSFQTIGETSNGYVEVVNDNNDNFFIFNTAHDYGRGNGSIDVIMYKLDGSLNISHEKYIGSSSNDYSKYIISDSEQNIYSTGLSFIDGKFNVYLSKLCTNSICNPENNGFCNNSFQCSYNDICFSKDCAKIIFYKNHDISTDRLLNSLSPLDLNIKEKVFDISQNLGETKEYIDLVEKITLYPADLFDTGSISLNINTDYRAVTINLILYVFNKEDPFPNELAFSLILNINGMDVDFEKKYEIIKYPKLEPYINSYETNYSIITLNYVYLHNEKLNSITLKVENLDINKYKVYAKSIVLFVSKCHPNCKECDQITFNCQSCFETNSNSINNCKCPEDKPIAYYDKNYENVKCASSYEENLCNKYRLNSNGFNFCSECKGSSFQSFDDFINPLCKCKTGYVWTGKDELTKECYSYFEDNCLNYDSTNLKIKEIIAWLSTVGNIIMDIKNKNEPIYDEIYYNFKLTHKPLPDEIFNFGKDVAFRISLKKGPDDVSNILYLSRWSNDLSEGININKNDLKKGLYDCEITNISQSSKLYNCKIKIFAFNPCSSTMYISIPYEGKILDGNSSGSGFSVSAEKITILDIPCINNNVCFFNEKFSSNIMVCDKLPCIQTKSSQFIPGDELNIKPTLSVTDGSPDKYSQSIETAAFLIKNSDGNIIAKFDVSKDFKLTIENGKKIFGFEIPVAGSLMSNSGYLEGARLSFNIIFKIDESLRRILKSEAQNGYSIIPPIDVKIQIDPEYLKGGSKYHEIIPEIRTNSLIIIFSFIISSLLLGVIYCYIRNKLKNKVNNNIIYDKANNNSDKCNTDNSQKNRTENNDIENIKI